jgi:hypothetical protein
MFEMKHTKILNGVIGLAFLALALFQVRCVPKPAVRVTPRQPLIFAVHVLVESTDEARGLMAGIPAMAKAGVNLLVCEIDYNYEFVPRYSDKGGIFFLRQKKASIFPAIRIK